MELQGAGYFLFLGLVVLVRSVLAPRWRIPLLLGASMAFYAMSSVPYLFMFLALSVFNYLAALNLSRENGGPYRTAVFGAILALDLLVLITFKYLSRHIQPWLEAIGLHDYASFKAVAPLGISYFTFQMVACVTDAYRRDWKLSPGLIRFLLFGLYFPQITSGPIPRAGRLLPQLTGDVEPTTDDQLMGLRLIAYGLFKKYVVANRLGPYVTQIFAVPPEHSALHYSTLPALLGCIFNALNLYADFSSYVDIALGSASLMGVRLDPNFNQPFISTSVTEFWRRWHMTLSFWLRDYLYMPLLIRIRDLGMLGVILALIFTFAVCGVWHDATWTYLFFGVAQGLAMSMELLTKRWRNRRLKMVPAGGLAAAGWFYTMSFFVLSEVLFRASSLSNAGMVFSSLFHFQLFSSAAELFAYKGPFDFVLAFVAVAVWFAVANGVRRVSMASTPIFVFACALLILFLGRMGTGQFIYAGF
jgi:D-alanyl-lipoteichoic acid acyltransferase DltB (MBOAT superfamily)